MYVVASGQSVDFFERDFFDGLLTIGVNQVYKRLPKVTYLVRKEGIHAAKLRGECKSSTPLPPQRQRTSQSSGRSWSSMRPSGVFATETVGRPGRGGPSAADKAPS